VSARAWLGALVAACALVSATRVDPAQAEPAAPPAGADAPLPGQTVDFAWDGRDPSRGIARPDLAWLGRAYVHPRARDAGRPLPLVVFLHGLNKALIKHRWMGGGQEGDVRRIVGDLMERGAIGPVLVAGPSSVVPAAVSHGASWGSFDLDRFIEHTERELKGFATVDRRRVIVAGHSGAGCSSSGGLATLGDAKVRPYAVLSIDTCMGLDLAERLAHLDAGTHVVVSYQSVTWQSRPFAAFEQTFARAAASSPPSPGVLREVDHLAPTRAPHDATVALTFERWLPKLVPPPTSP
jgi:hypothetical protein